MNKAIPKRPGKVSSSQIEELNGLLLSLHEVGRILNQETDPVRLCHEVCRQLAQTRGYVTVWIGRAVPATRQVLLQAIAGAEAAAYTSHKITWDDVPNGQGPVGTALRERRPVVFDDLANDPRYLPWRDVSVAAGAASMAAFPLIFQGRLLGALAVKHGRVAAFDETEVRLLGDLASDLARAWHGLEEAAAHARTRENLETLVEAMPEAVFFKDGDGRWLVVNSLAKQLFQLDRRPWQGRTDLEMAGDLPVLKATHLNCLASDEQAWSAGRTTLSEEQVTAPDGSLLVFEVSKVPLFHEDGRRKALVIIGRDATRNRAAQRELQQASDRLAEMNLQLEWRVQERTHRLAESEEMFRTIAASANTAIFLIDAAGKVYFWNRAAEQMFGWTGSEAVGQDLGYLLALPEELFVFTDPPGKPPQLSGIIRSKLETTARCRDGGRISLDLSLAMVSLQGQHYVVGLGNDITERRLAEQELARYAWEVEDLYNRAPCGYHSLDKEGLVVQINHTELGWLGYTREEMVGRPISDFLTPASQELFRKKFAGFTGEDRQTNVEREFVCKNGAILPVVINSVVIRDSAGNFVRTRSTVFDNTERLKTNRKLHRALEQAAAANRAKTDFLANMSHEIRTPMNAIMGYAQLLRRDPDLPAAARHQTEIICRNGQNLLSLLNSILELSRIEEGRVAMKHEVFSPLELFTELVSLFQEPAQEKQLALVFAPGRGLPESVEADQDKIRRAVANLLSNAIKFTQQGGIRLKVTVAPAGPEQSLLVVEVRDTGPGITPEELPHLFKRFAQTASGQRTGTGTGLGLYISSEYVRLMGGTLTVDSHPGRGSVFRLAVPVHAAHGQAAGPDDRQLPRLPAAPGDVPWRALVVDDILDNREMLQQLLQHVGFEVRAVASGAAALELAATWPPRLILMDAHMPEMDGCETIRRLKAGPAPVACKIIMVSASAFEGDRQAALAAGADDFVAKPYRDLELVETIRIQLGLQPAPPAAAPVPVSAEDIGRLPAESRLALRTAVVEADYDRVNQLLKKLQLTEPAIAQKLAGLVQQFDADRLLQLLPE